MIHTQKMQEMAIEHFEANVLDGDKINDCGRTMVSAEAVCDYLPDLIARVVRETERKIVDRIREYSKFAFSEQPKPQDASDKRWEIHYMGYREAVKDIINLIKQHG